MKQKLLSFLLAILVGVQAMAQDRTVSGKVTSADDGTVLPGVSVTLKGSTKGTSTDANGVYKITVPANATLAFSFIGFTTSEIKVGSRSIIDAQLVTNAQELNEVVITNYGSSLNKREFTGASSKIKGESFKDLPVQSFDRAIQGRAAGVQVTSANGVPGGAVQIRVRGIGSISAGSDPLYIVDGVQLNSTNNSSFTQSNPLAFLNPNDIESIEILKDAAAASIYGSQAANGVVLVTTKRGKAGKTKIEFGYTKGFVSPIQYLNVLNTQQWIQVRSEAVLNASVAGTEFNTARQSVLSSVRLDPALTDAQIAALPTYDWQKESFRSGSSDCLQFHQQSI